MEDMENNQDTPRPLGRTLAMSVLFFGEAARFNRGKTRGDDFDFKYLAGPDRRPYPYVSSQSFKKHWREALTSAPSPIIRPTKADGSPKNQAYTAGDPINYVDDDLFGFMVAGADAEAESTKAGAADADAEGTAIPADPDEALDPYLLRTDDLKNNGRDLLRALRDADKRAALSRCAREVATEEQRALLEHADDKIALTLEQQQMLVDLLNELVRNEALYEPQNLGETLSKKAAQEQEKVIAAGDPLKTVEANRRLLGAALASALEKPALRDTTRRTAPIRMHALVAFSGIRTAKDFQTFSRDVALTGKDSVLNPNPVGLYTAWMKTRILIEGHRIGKFYVNKNLDVLRDQVVQMTIRTEVDPYSRDRKTVEYVQLPVQERTARFRAAVRALADVNNQHGPASGALHDGSLRPRAFVAALMTCADSPFDFVWVDTGSRPRLSLARLRAALRDYEDLFADRRVYVGLPLDSELYEPDGSMAEGEAADVAAAIRAAGFDPIVDTPRRALLRLAAEVELPEEGNGEQPS